MKREYRLYGRKFLMDLYFKNFVVQTVTKFVKYINLSLEVLLKYMQILDIA